MNRISNLIFLLLCSVVLTAQPEKGSWMLSADIGGFFNKNAYSRVGDSTWQDSYETTSMWLTPKAGYFVADPVVLGLQMTLGNSNSHYSGGISGRTKTFGLGPFMRVFLNRQKMAPFLEAGGGIWNRVDHLTFAPTSLTYKYPGWQAYGGIGLAIFIGEKAALEGIIMYEAEAYEEEGSMPVEQWKNQGVRLNIGVSFYL